MENMPLFQDWTTWVSWHQKGKSILDFTEARDDWGGSGISWTICKSSTPHSRQITMPTTHHSIFYRLDALPNAQVTVSKYWRHLTGYQKIIKYNSNSIIENARYSVALQRVSMPCIRYNNRQIQWTITNTEKQTTTCYTGLHCRTLACTTKHYQIIPSLA